MEFLKKMMHKAYFCILERLIRAPYICSDETDVFRGDKSIEIKFDSLRSGSCYLGSDQEKSCMSIPRIKKILEKLTAQNQIRRDETD
jgi:hypothetical protein